MTSELGTPSGLRRRIPRRWAADGAWLWLAPLVVSVAYLITFASQLKQLLATSYLNADAASGPVIGQLYGGAPASREVILGHLGWYSTLLYELATRWIPLHRQIWEASPIAIAFGSAALIGWALWRIAGRWAGIIGASIAICAGPGLLSLLLVLNDHAPTWFTIALLGAFLVLLEHDGEKLALAPLVALSAVVGVILGANAASDDLLTIGGAVPFALAAGVTWAIRRERRSGRAAAVVIGTCAVALLAGVIVHAYVHHEHVISASDPRTRMLVAPESVGSNFRWWWESLAVLGNGNFFGLSVGFSSVLAFICAALTIAGLLLVLRIARTQVTRSLTGEREAPVSSRDLATLAWCIFWASSLVLLSVAFIFSAIPEGLTSDRYLAGAIYAVAALVPLLGANRLALRIAISAAVTVYAFAGFLALAQQRIAPPTSPSDQIANQVARIARKEGLTVGYGGYWDSAPITWATHLAVQVFPVDDCDGNQHLCAFELHLITSWYKPRPATRTFLLSDTTYPSVPSAPTPDLGRPTAVHQIGPVTMYVYPYDIASRLFAL